MSVKLALSVYSVDNKHLSSSEKHVLVRLALFGSNDGKNIYPSYSRIVQDTGLSRSTAIRAIESLIQKGFLTKKIRKKRNGRDTSIYIIQLRKLNTCQNPSSKEFNEALGSVTMTLGGSKMKLGSVTTTPPLVSPRHHPSVMVTPKSNLKVSIKVNKPPSPFLRGGVADAPDVCVSDFKKSSEKKRPPVPDRFAEVWEAYGKIGTKKAAQSAYLKAIKSIKHEELVERLKAYHASYAARKEKGEWQPNHKHFSTWLNQQCWEDEACLPKPKEKTEEEKRQETLEKIRKGEL